MDLLLADADIRDDTLMDLRRSAPATAHVDALCARFTSTKPGMQSVLKALAQTRQHRANMLGSDPKTYLDITKDRDMAVGMKKTEDVAQWGAGKKANRSAVA